MKLFGDGLGTRNFASPICFSPRTKFTGVLIWLFKIVRGEPYHNEGKFFEACKVELNDSLPIFHTYPNAILITDQMRT